MYQSRLHMTNGIISVALDALSGEMLEFVRERTADNVIKNHVRRTRSLLDAVRYMPDGEKRLWPPRYEEIRLDASLTPKVEVAQGDGVARAVITFPYLVSEGKKVDVGARVTIELKKDDPRACWRLTLDNRTDCEIDDVAFPAVDGVWLGEDWRDDVLVYPHFAGCRMDNPTEQLASEPEMISWKWQEYVYRFKLGQDTGKKDDRDAYVRRLNYSGEASMVWMDLYDAGEDTGLYITCRNSSLKMKSLRMESFGRCDPGVGLAILHHPALKKGEWSSEECVLALHGGDWHWAADDYRAWFDTLGLPRGGKLRPQWFMESPGLMAHYDFQYQGGGIVHRFSDIPDLMADALKVGIHHLLISGWNEDGFDYGFPHYTPNHKLGTPEELRDAVRKAREMGGHVAFYINSRLCNTAFEDQTERIRESAVMLRSGDMWIEKYGADELSFASMCINEPRWRHLLRDRVRYMTHEIGADSMYLDQFAMATSLMCYHPGHEEHRDDPAAWNQGYEKLLAEMTRDAAPEGMALLYEGCNDNFGRLAGGQLISELHCPFRARMPQVYKYTFPDQILMDMMNPRRHSAMRPEHVARHSTELLHNAFTMGAYFWCYDLKWDNQWHDDPEQEERLKKLIALRTAWLKTWGHGRFTDTVGITEIPDSCQVRGFALEKGLLLACAAEKGLKGTIKVRWDGEPPRAAVMTMAHPEAAEADCVTKAEDGWIAVRLPEDEAAVIVL